jgi:hypothetical protein
VLSRLALQALSVGLLRTFDRPGGPLGGVLLAARERLGGRPDRRGGSAAGQSAAYANHRDLRDSVEGRERFRDNKSEDAGANQGRESYIQTYSRSGGWFI